MSLIKEHLKHKKEIEKKYDQFLYSLQDKKFENIVMINPLII